MTKRESRASALMRMAFVALVSVSGLATASCGASDAVPPAVPVNPVLVIDSDPLALFPGGALALANVDARAFYASGSSGAQLAALAESVLPIGQEVGFSASRDVDRMLVAVYASGGVDAVAILSGRFDVAKMQAAAAAHAPTKAGTPWVAFPYAGRTLYTASNLAFAPLTDHTMAAGSESAVRRVLDRLAQVGAQPRIARETADWMLATVESPGSSFALAADIASIPPAALHGWPLPAAMTGLARAAVIGDFHPPGFNVASTLSYVDPQRASAGAASLQQLGALITMASKFGAGPQLQNLSIVPEGPNVGCKFALDDAAMKNSIASIMKLFSVASARPPG